MEYKDIYEDCYNKTFANREKEIKLELIKAKSESRAFNFSLNLIIKNTGLLISENCIKSNKNLSLLEETHNRNLSNYNENAIELTLKNDIYPEYLKLNEDQLLSKYSFNRFIYDLGTLYALNEVNRLFRNNSRLFEMMFELNDFKDFEIKEYQMVLDNTPTFRKLHKRLYPEREIDKKIIKNEDTVSYIDSKFSLLNNEEKILLLNIIYNAFTKNVDNDKLDMQIKTTH